MAPRSAFSLVELSIVLVILGLLVGGIMGGQALIRAAELRSVGTEYGRFTTAISSFRDQYAALPGDFHNATKFWGIAGGTTGNDLACRDVATTNGTTCNGNNDARINAHTSSREQFRFWQHLASAGMIEGTYNGRYCGLDGLCADKTNSPGTRLSNSGVWFAYYFGTVGTGVGNMFQGEYGNSLELSGMSTSNPYLPLVNPTDGWNVDTKLDDGKPGTGKLVVRAGAGGVNACTTAAGDSYAQAATATYRVSSGTLLCSFVFRDQF